MVIIGERLVYVTLMPEVAFVYVRGILQEKKKSLYFYFVLWWSHDRMASVSSFLLWGDFVIASQQAECDLIFSGRAPSFLVGACVPAAAVWPVRLLTVATSNRHSWV